MKRASATLPAVDRDSRPFWEALGRHQFLLQQCGSCGAKRWPPRALCGRCGSLDASWVPASGRGRVVSWIVSHHPFDRSLPTPYVVLTVRLDDQDDILMPGGYAGAPGGAGLSIGLPVEAEFEDLEVAPGEPALARLRWRATGGSGA